MELTRESVLVLFFFIKRKEFWLNSFFKKYTISNFCKLRDERVYLYRYSIKNCTEILSTFSCKLKVESWKLKL